MALNQSVKGFRVFAKTVPAVTDVWCRQEQQTKRPREAGQASDSLQRGQTKPFGHRSSNRYSRHASSVANHFSSSKIVFGYLSGMPNTTCSGRWREVDSPYASTLPRGTPARRHDGSSRPQTGETLGVLPRALVPGSTFNRCCRTGMTKTLRTGRQRDSSLRTWY